MKKTWTPKRKKTGLPKGMSLTKQVGFNHSNEIDFYISQKSPQI